MLKYLRGRPVALAVEELHRDQRVEEIADAARVQAELGAELRAGQAPIGEPGEDAELDRGQEHLGRPEGEGGGQNRCDVNVGGHRESLLQRRPWSD